MLVLFKKVDVCASSTSKLCMHSRKNEVDLHILRVIVRLECHCTPLPSLLSFRMQHVNIGCQWEEDLSECRWMLNAILNYFHAITYQHIYAFLPPSIHLLHDYVKFSRDFTQTPSSAAITQESLWVSSCKWKRDSRKCQCMKEISTTTTFFITSIKIFITIRFFLFGA